MSDEDEIERARRLVEDDGFVTVYPAVATLSGVARHGIFSDTRLMQELPEDNSKAVAPMPDMSEPFFIQGHVQMFGRLYIEDGVVKFDGDVDATAQVLFDTLLPMVQEMIDQSDLRARAEKAEAELARLRHGVVDKYEDSLIIERDQWRARAEKAEAEVARLREAAEYFAQWDHCWPGNINLETAVFKIRAALKGERDE